MFVNLKTGQIHKPPVGQAEAGVERYIVPLMVLAEGTGAEFRVDSKLFTVPICDGADCGIYDFLWEQDRWRLLHREAIKPPR
jgi:hypothetical protein